MRSAGSGAQAARRNEAVSGRAFVASTVAEAYSEPMEVLDQSAFHVGMRCRRRLWFSLREGHRHNRHPAAVGKRQEVLRVVRERYPKARFRVPAEHRGVRVVADLLDGTTLLKVQAGTRLRPRHWQDLALQTWV